MQRFPRVNHAFLSYFLVVFFLLLSNTVAEPVAKFAWTGSLTGLADKTLEVPLGTVAMSEYIYVSTVLDNLTEKDPCSIMFIIDNSSSNSTDKTDWSCERYRVVSELVDIIYQKAPETKVGLIMFGSRLWMYNQDDPLFTTHNGDGGTGAFIEPLDLNKTYSGHYQTKGVKGSPSESFDYDLSGLEILQMYLETRDYKFMSSDPAGGKKSRYQPTHSPVWPDPSISHGSELTNISRAFEAAKEAHLVQTPSLSKNRHFNIFFSDGKAGVGTNSPDYPITEKYISGTDVPTTFTVFYKSDANDLAALNSMTSNIKNNGYSTNNNLSNIWNMTDWDAIKTTLEQDVFNKILTSTKGTPTEITIKTESENNWDSTGFKYKDLFPLQKNSTPFDIDLTVHIIRDSLDDLGNIIKTEEKDTSLTVDFDVAVADIVAPDSMIITQWGRDMFLFYQGDTIKQADSQMDELEVRFEDYKIDTIFGYADIEAVIESKNKGDREELTLTEKAPYFTNSFKLSVNGAVTNNDKTLSLSPVDSIIIIYENPDLPLDTIRKAIYFTDAVDFTVTKATYFDEDADGKVDLAKVEIEGSRINDYADDIYDGISFTSTDIQKQSYTLNSNVFNIVVQSSGDIKTVTDDNDIVEFKDTVVLAQGSKLLPSQATAIDSMAPVIIDALFIDSIKETSLDEIDITFSENVTDEKANNALKFIKKTSNTEFSGTLSHINTNASNVSYYIADLTNNQTIEENDSVWINESASQIISDNISNKQDNPKNRKCPIRVRTIPDGIIISKASYLDENADGKIDLIKIEWSDTTGTVDKATIEDALTLPSIRSFNIEDITVEIDRIELKVTEGTTTTNTAVATSETVVITDTITFSDNIRVLPSSIEVTDSLAPVILSALFTKGDGQGVSDMLDIEFSEVISENSSDEQFNFCDLTNNKYRINCTVQTFNGKSASYEITNYIDNRQPQYNDSIWINSSADVKDVSSSSNSQNNPENIKRPISVINSCTILSASYLEKDNFSDGLIDTIEVEFNTELNDDRAGALLKLIDTPTGRSLTKTSNYSFEDKTLKIEVKETGSPKTSVDKLIDILTIKNGSIDSIQVYTHFVAIQDNLAPVATRAIYKPGSLIDSDNYNPDTLVVKFSEDIESISDNEPFDFHDIMTDDEYEMNITSSLNISASEILFTVNSSTKEFPQSGDSLWINENNTVSDLNSNNQDRDNKRVPLEVAPYPYDYEVLIYPNPFVYDYNTKNSDKVAERYLLSEDSDIGKNALVILAIPHGRVPFTLVPSGSISIYDAVGNHVNTLDDLKFNPESGCIYSVWKNPKNSLGRELGSGTVIFTYLLEDGNGKTVELQGAIGIKRND